MHKTYNHFFHLIKHLITYTKELIVEEKYSTITLFVISCFVHPNGDGKEMQQFLI